MLRAMRSSGIRIVLVLAFSMDRNSVALSTVNEGMLSGWAWITWLGALSSPDRAGWLYLRPLLPSEGLRTFAEKVSEYSMSRFDFNISADSVAMA